MGRRLTESGIWGRILAVTRRDVRRSSANRSPSDVPGQKQRHPLRLPTPSRFESGTEPVTARRATLSALAPVDRASQKEPNQHP